VAGLVNQERMTDEQRVREIVRRVVYRTLGVSKRSSGSDASRRAGRLVTETDLQGLTPGGEFVVPAGALITPLARQTAMERNLTLVEGAAATTGPVAGPRVPSAGVASAKTVAIGADHGGFELKEALKEFIGGVGYAVADCGAHSPDSVDYPDFALAVAQLVAQGRAWRGILVDGAGIGSCMAANKVPGVRAAMCYDEATAVNSREHNDANVLTLGAGLIGADLARRIVRVWLETPAGGGRHARRVSKIMQIEQRFLKKG
jgi:ribose 5-phosphate isomerase B